MKKTLLALLALTFPGIDYAHISNEQHVHGAFVEIIGPYKHPKAKKVGDIMPQPLGKPITVTYLYILNSEGINGATRDAGKIYGFDRNPEDGKNISEYEYLARICDENKVYAAYDVPHKLIYVDSSRNGYIDSITKLDSILNASLPMIPIKCKGESIKKKMLRRDI